MNAEIKAALEQERKAAEFLAELKAAIIKKGADAPSIPGVEPMTGSVRCAAVSFSTISKYNNLSAKTYLQDSQAEAIERKLTPCKSVSALCDAIKSMVEEKCIRFSDGENVMLNESTLAVLNEYWAEFS